MGRAGVSIQVELEIGNSAKSSAHQRRYVVGHRVRNNPARKSGVFSNVLSSLLVVCGFGYSVVLLLKTLSH